MKYEENYSNREESVFEIGDMVMHINLSDRADYGVLLVFCEGLISLKNPSVIWENDYDRNSFVKVPKGYKIILTQE